MRYNFVSVKMAIPKENDSKCWQGWKEKGNPAHC